MSSVYAIWICTRSWNRLALPGSRLHRRQDCRRWRAPGTGARAPRPEGEAVAPARSRDQTRVLPARRGAFLERRWRVCGRPSLIRCPFTKCFASVRRCFPTSPRRVRVRRALGRQLSRDRRKYPDGPGGSELLSFIAVVVETGPATAWRSRSWPYCSRRSALVSAARAKHHTKSSCRSAHVARRSRPSVIPRPIWRVESHRPARGRRKCRARSRGTQRTRVSPPGPAWCRGPG